MELNQETVVTWFHFSDMEDNVSRRPSVSSSTGQPTGPSSPFTSGSYRSSPGKPISPSAPNVGFSLQSPPAMHSQQPPTTNSPVSPALAIDYPPGTYTSNAHGVGSCGPYSPNITMPRVSRAPGATPLQPQSRPWGPSQSVYAPEIYDSPPYGYSQPISSYSYGGGISHDAAMGEDGYGDFPSSVAPGMVSRDSHHLPSPYSQPPYSTATTTSARVAHPTHSHLPHLGREHLSNGSGNGKRKEIRSGGGKT